jgi:hypothetical protein
MTDRVDKKKRFIPRKRKDIESEINPDDIHIEEKKDSLDSSSGHIHKRSLEEFSSGSVHRVIPNSQNKSIAELNRPIDNNDVNLN